jgi:CRP-like cAMP-binding protein
MNTVPSNPPNFQRKRGSAVLRKGMPDQNLLNVLSLPEYTGLLSMFHEKKYRKKELIYHPNHGENNVFIVKEGKVRIFLASSDKEFTLSILEPGDAYSTHTRAFTQALCDCVLLICKTQDFGQIMVQNPAFAMNTVKVLGDLLKNSFTIITNLAFQNTNKRMKEYLLSMAEDKGVLCERGILIETGQDTGQVAMIIGASRQTVSAIFSEFCRLGIMERINRKTILITDLEKLKLL